MFKRIAMLFALLLMPAAVMAQDHAHPGAPKKHDHAAAAAKHTHFPQLLIQKRAELELTDEQVAKLEAVAAKMSEHHEAMAAHHEKMAEHHAEKKAEKAAKAEMKHDGMKHEGMAHDKAEAHMHDGLLSIFTPAQLEKVKPLMKEHMAAVCSSEGGEHCKMIDRKKKAE